MESWGKAGGVVIVHDVVLGFIHYSSSDPTWSSEWWDGTHICPLHCFGTPYAKLYSLAGCGQGHGLTPRLFLRLDMEMKGVQICSNKSQGSLVLNCGRVETMDMEQMCDGNGVQDGMLLVIIGHQGLKLLGCRDSGWTTSFQTPTPMVRY
jgi:hypothetical protein